MNYRICTILGWDVQEMDRKWAGILDHTDNPFILSTGAQKECDMTDLPTILVTNNVCYNVLRYTMPKMG